MAITLVIMIAAALVAAALALWQQRQGRSAPTATPGEPPTSLDRNDFRGADAAWLIAVFTSATCSSCEAVLAELNGYATDQVVVTNVEVAADAALHKKYAIDSVPTAVIVDATGDAKLACVGPLGPDHRAALATTLGLNA